MSEARLHRLRMLENRVANTLAVASPSFGCPQETPYGTYCLTTTEQDAMLKQSRERMRRARLVQVRAQEMLFASRRVEQVRDRRRRAKLSLLSELKTEWKAGQTRHLEDLEEECAAALNTVGRAHRAAARIQRLKEVKEVTDALRTEERHCCAVLRYAEALQKEYAKRDQLENKKGIALERRKQMEDTAEMDRNLARVSAYGAKIRSKLRQIKEVFQPECKADFEGAKLRDYKYTFMHNHWASLKDKTNDKENDANAWEAADRKRRDHEQIRLRQGEIAKVAKQRVARRGQAAHVHIAKKQEIKRLENELKNVQRREKEQKIAAMLSGETGHLSGVQDISGLQRPAGSPCLVAGEKDLEGRSPRMEHDSTKSREINVESLRLSPLEIHVKSMPDSSPVTITLHVSGKDVDAHQVLKASTEKMATAAVLDGSGLLSPSNIGKPECSQAHPHSKQAESPGSGKNPAPGKFLKLKSGAVRSTVPRSKHRLGNVVPATEGQALNMEQGRTNLAGKDRAVLTGSRKLQADVSSLTEGNNKRATLRRCVRCGEGEEDMRVGDKGLLQAGCATSNSCGNSHKWAAHGHGGALASAMSLLDEICGKAEVLDKLQEAQKQRCARGKLPVSMKHRIRRTREQLEALEEELYGQRNGLQIRRVILKGNPDVLGRSSREVLENTSLAARRRKGLEKHMTRMATRSKTDQIGENLWNILPSSDVSTKKIVPGEAGHTGIDMAPKVQLGKKRTKGKINGTKLLEAGRRQHKQQQQAKEQAFYSMQVEDFEFLKQLQESLQKLEMQSSYRDGRISPTRDKIPPSYKGMVKRRSGGNGSTLGGRRGQREPPLCGKISSKAKHRSRRTSEELAPPQEPGAEIGPWTIDKDSVGLHRSRMSKKTKQRSGRQPDQTHGLRDPRTQRTVAQEVKRGRRVHELGRGKTRSALTTSNNPNVGSQDSPCSSKGTTERCDAKNPDPGAGRLERQVTSESSAMNQTADDMLIEKKSNGKVVNMSCSSIEIDITDIEAAVETALALHDQNTGPDEDRAGVPDDGSTVQSVATQVDLRGQLGAKCGHCESTQTEDTGKLAFATPPLVPGPGNAGCSWGKIWEEVCESIDGELDRLGSGSDWAKEMEQVHNSYRQYTADKLKHLEHSLEGRPSSPPKPVVLGNSVLDSSVVRGKDPQVNDVGTETEQPSLDSMLGSLSDQVRELDERLRTATSSAVASSWAITESSRRSRRPTSRDGLPGSSTDQIPVSDTSWLPIPPIVGGPVWKPTGDSVLAELETSIPSVWADATIMPRVRMRSTTLHFEGKGDSEGISSDTASPVSPLCLCFDTLHDMHRRTRDGVNRPSVHSDGLYSQGVVPGGKFTEFPCSWVTTDEENSGGHTRRLQLPGKDVQITHVGRNVLVLPCRPRRTHSSEAGDSGQTLREANLFLTNEESSGISSGCKAARMVLTSLSSLDLDMGESLLTGSIDFSLWSPEKMRDIFDSPLATSTEVLELLPGSQPARKRLVPFTVADDNTAPASKTHDTVLPKAACTTKKMKGPVRYHHRKSDRPHQLFGSPGKWSIKPRLVTQTTYGKTDCHHVTYDNAV